MTDALRVEHLHAFYGSSHVLQGVSLHVAAGEVLAVLGRNGMGKTTLMHTVVGFVRSRSGSVELLGRRVEMLAPERIARAGLALVPQGRRVFGSLSVGEHLAVAARDGGAEGWTADDVCDRFPVLGQRWNQAARLMSGGEQQMLAIARALVANRPVVLMDEPSEGLDPSRVRIVGGVVAEMRARGTAVVVVEQKVQFALGMADRIEVMERGRIIYRTDRAAASADPSQLLDELGFG